MTRARRQRTAAVVVLAAGLGLLAACADSTGGGASTSTVVATTAATTSVAPATSAAGPASTATTPPQPIGSPATVGAAPPSPTGVPGIDSGDAFCAAWARYGGTVQIIAVAVNFGGLDGVHAAEVELQSAPTITRAVDEIEQTWPGEIVAERDAAIEYFLGPFDRRAHKALDELLAAGATVAEVDAVDQAWQQALAVHDPDSPTVDVVLPGDLATAVASGAAAFEAAVTPWGSDPSLTADLDAVPATKAYLATNCPDLASIGIGDDI